jgi:hypothetical protein
MTSRYRASAFSELSERALGNFYRMGGRGTFARGGLGLRPLRRWAGSGQSRSETFGGQQRCSTPAATDTRTRTSSRVHAHRHTHTSARASPVSCRIFSGTELGPATSSPELDSESPCRISTWTAHPSHTCAATWPALLVARCVVRRTRQVYAVLDGSRGFYAPMAAPLWRSETG